jgi:hypothetical protein
VAITGIVLVDSTDSIRTKVTAPLESKNMMMIGESYDLPVYLKNGLYHLAHSLFTGLGRKGKDTLAIRRLLFGSPSELGPQQIATITAIATVLSAWQTNVQYIEDRFNRARLAAIADPSLPTFHPLTLLRRNIADLDHALKQARSRWEPDSGAWVLRDQDRNLGQRVLELFGPRYDALLYRVHVMSTNINNEIQLVIGSVTVQARNPPLLLAQGAS